MYEINNDGQLHHMDIIMNILFLTIAYDSARNIYSDLMNEFRNNGHIVYVVCQTEWRDNLNTYLHNENGINIFQVKTGNLTGKVSIIEKGLATLSIDYLFKRAISTYIPDVKFDLVIYSTPPITLYNVVKYIRKRDGAGTYLLLKDIFPQNAVDLGLIRENGFVHNFFRCKEKKLYCISDYIGCMSVANRQYLIAHNSDIDSNRIEVNPNSIRPLTCRECEKNHIMEIRKKYGIPGNATLFIYGGNLGLPQGLEFLIDICREIKNRENIFLLIVGDGSRYDFISAELTQIGAANVKLFKKFSKAEYDELLTVCDVGLIFLSPRFTIPNFPSRLTAYMEMGLPILAATDTITDIKDILSDANCGFWSKNGDLNSFVKNMEKLVEDNDLRHQMGQNGRIYLEEHYTVDKSYQIIMRHFAKMEETTNV